MSNTNEREVLIDYHRDLEQSSVTEWVKQKAKATADMLEADGQELTRLRELARDAANAATQLQKQVLVLKAQQVAPPYDQQALELCPECGWKAIMPGEPCFVCNMKTEAQQVAVPDGWALVPIEPTLEMIMAMEYEWMYGSNSDMAKREYKAMLAAAQGAKK